MTAPRKRKPSTHGGQRRGAGRPPSPAGRLTRAWTSLPPDLLAWLSGLYAGDLAEGLRDTVRRRHAQETRGTGT